MFHCVENILVIGLAYFGLTVGAGFASGQEVLQYYVSYGTWGLAAGLIVLLLMPITAMVFLQYGSYFRATSHGKVFDNVTSAFTAWFLDYTLTGSQFCLGLVMMAVALLIRMEDVADADLPTFLLITQVHPALGPIAAIATYLMIFSSCLSVMYSMGRRVSVGNPKAFRLRYAILVGIAFLLTSSPSPSW